MNKIWSRIGYIEHALDQKANEVVSIQLLQQRAELEDMRVMIKQLSATLETMQKPGSNSLSTYEELHPVAAGRLTSPPRKRGLLRSFSHSYRPASSHKKGATSPVHHQTLAAPSLSSLN